MMSRRTLARTVGVVLVFAAILTSVVGFTASNTVPVTYAGKSGAQAATPVQLAPSECAALALTAKIVMAAAATTVTGTSADELIIGVDKTGKVSYNGGAGSDCIVAGGQSGTKNTLDGGTGTNDICISPAAASTTFKNCEQTYNSS